MIRRILFSLFISASFVGPVSVALAGPVAVPALKPNAPFNPASLSNNAAWYSLTGTANDARYLTTTASFTGTGTATSTLISTAFVGVGTAFLAELGAGDTVYTNADVLIGTIQSVTDNTNAVLTSNGAAAITGAAFKIVKANPRIQLIADRSGNSAVNGLVLPGDTANYISRPTVAISGSWTLTVDLSLKSWLADGAFHYLVSHASGNAGLQVRIFPGTGIIETRIGDGASFTNFNATVALSQSAYSRHTITVAYVDNASVTYYVDGVQLGDVVPVNKTLANSGATLKVGENIIGSIYGYTLGNIAGFNPTVAAKLAATLPDAVTGTWTINTSGALGARISGARDLVQFTPAKQPTLSSTNGNHLTTDGANDYLRSASFTSAQPTTEYTVSSLVTWVSGAYLWDGASGANSAAVIMTTSTPRVSINAGSSVAENSNLVVGTPAVFTEFLSGASSSLQINATTATTGNAGTASPNGVTIGASGASTAANFSAITFSEKLVRSATDSAQTKSQIYNYERLLWAVVP